MSAGCRGRRGDGAHLAMWRLPRNLKCWRHSLKGKEKVKMIKDEDPTVLLFTKCGIEATHSKMLKKSEISW